MFLESACDMRPHLLEVLLTVLGKEGGKGAFLRQGVWHVTRLELISNFHDFGAGRRSLFTIHYRLLEVWLLETQ